MTVIIDISKHQGTLTNEQILKWYQKGLIKGVIVRATWGTNEDIKFKYFADGLTKNGIPFGAYCYSYALSTKSGLKECAKLQEVIKNYKLDYPLYIDMEDADNWKSKRGSLSSFPFSEICEQFCDYFENLKYYTGIYASDSWFNSYLKSSTLNRFDKWVANWSTSPRYVSKYGMHQFTSDYKLDGYNERLDANYQKYDYPTIIKKNGLNGYSKNEDKQEEIIDYEALYIATKEELEKTEAESDLTQDKLDKIKEILK